MAPHYFFFLYQSYLISARASYHVNVSHYVSVFFFFSRRLLSSFALSLSLSKIYITDLSSLLLLPSLLPPLLLLPLCWRRDRRVRVPARRRKTEGAKTRRHLSLSLPLCELSSSFFCFAFTYVARVVVPREPPPPPSMSAVIYLRADGNAAGGGDGGGGRFASALGDCRRRRESLATRLASRMHTCKYSGLLTFGKVCKGGYTCVRLEQIFAVYYNLKLTIKIKYPK